jgi:NIMA (never in mitosis gene a)-related kinase
MAAPAMERRSSMADFIITQALGKGSYGSVFKVKRKQDGQFYAVKEVNIKKLQPKEREDAVNEIRIMASIKHKNIVRYCDAFVERDNLYIAMEFAEHGDISRQVDKFKAANKYIKEDIIWSYLLQMCNGLALMHSRNVLHRDIKPKNVFLTGKNHIRLGDLGCAKLMKSGMARTQIGAFATLQHTQKRIRAHCRRLPVSFLFCINISLRAPYA